MNVLKDILLPPGCFAVVLILALAIRQRYGRFGNGLLIATVLAFWAVATPLVGDALIQQASIDRDRGALPKENAAIVILAGTFQATASGGEPAGLTMARLARGVEVHRRTGLPILVTGGPMKHLDEPGARVMARTLRMTFGVTAAFIEPQARNTMEHGRRVAVMLADTGIDHVLVVSHRWHLKRAVHAFARTSLETVPVPVYPQSPRDRKITAQDLVPSFDGLTSSYYGLYEMLGLLWYRIGYD